MLRLTDPVAMEEEDASGLATKEGSNASAPDAAANKDQTQPVAAATAAAATTTSTTARATSPQPAAATLEEPPTGAALVRRITVGVRVVRGPDWKWGDQVILYL